MQTARVHHASRRRGGSVAARGARAAGASGCGASACSCPQPRTIRNVRPASAAFLQGLRAIGLDRSAATCGSTPAGPRPMPTTFADTRRNWSRSRRTSSWPLAPRPWGRCCRRPAPCRSCSRSSSIRSAPASSRAWRGRAATPPVSCMFEYSIGGKWLELLKQIAPGVTRAAVLRDPAIASGIGQFGAIQSVAPSLGVEVSPVNVRDAGEIERAVAAFARAPNGGLIVTASALAHASSRSDRHAGGPAQAARGLLRTLLRRRRRPDLLWA